MDKIGPHQKPRVQLLPTPTCTLLCFIGSDNRALLEIGIEKDPKMGEIPVITFETKTGKQTLSPNEEGKKDGNKKSPKKIAAGTTLGGEEFQVRAVVVADPAQQASATAVRLSLWGRGDPSDPTASLRKLGGFSFAQAEYYYSGSLNEEWLWNMKWRGRLRHFRMPTIDESKKNLRDACERWQSINCDKYLSLVDTWKDLLLH